MINLIETTASIVVGDRRRRKRVSKAAVVSAYVMSPCQVLAVRYYNEHDHRQASEPYTSLHRYHSYNWHHRNQGINSMQCRRSTTLRIMSIIPVLRPGSVQDFISYIGMKATGWEWGFPSPISYQPLLHPQQWCLGELADKHSLRQKNTLHNKVKYVHQPLLKKLAVNVLCLYYMILPVSDQGLERTTSKHWLWLHSVAGRQKQLREQRKIHRKIQE